MFISSVFSCICWQWNVHHVSHQNTVYSLNYILCKNAMFTKKRERDGKAPVHLLSMLMVSNWSIIENLGESPGCVMLCHVSAQLWVHICPVLQNVKCKRKWNQSTFGLWDRVFGYNQLTTLHNASRDVFRNLDAPFQDGSPSIPVETAFEIHEGFPRCTFMFPSQLCCLDKIL